MFKWDVLFPNFFSTCWSYLGLVKKSSLTSRWPFFFYFFVKKWKKREKKWKKWKKSEKSEKKYFQQLLMHSTISIWWHMSWSEDAWMHLPGNLQVYGPTTWKGLNCQLAYPQCQLHKATAAVGSKVLPMAIQWSCFSTCTILGSNSVSTTRSTCWISVGDSCEYLAVVKFVSKYPIEWPRVIFHTQHTQSKIILGLSCLLKWWQIYIM